MIGIFDSGQGGLTVMCAVRDVLPSSDIVYFGDTKNAPYGLRSRRELSELTARGLKLLQDRGATSLVSACNSVSASLVPALFDSFLLPSDRLIEMVGPTVRHFKDIDMRLAFCATTATIESGIYQNAFAMIGKEVIEIPIPDLAGAIEQGASREEIRVSISKALAGTEGTFDILILACTHFPLVAEVFREVLGPAVGIFDPAIAVAQRVEHQFWPREAGNGETRFVLSQDSVPFRSMVERLFPNHAYTIEVVDPVR